MKEISAISKEETILFARQLALAISSDIPLTKSLEIIMEKTDSESLKKVLMSIIDKLTMGEPFSEAMQTYELVLTPFFVQMILIGEESGNLPEVLEQVAATYEKQIETTNKLKSALTYPLILTTLMFGVILLLVIQIMPMFNDVLVSLGGEMPAITAAIISVSMFLKNNLFVITAILSVVIIGLIIYGRTEKGIYFFDGQKLKLPIISELTSTVLAALFARNLSILISSGMSFQHAFKLIQPTMNNQFVKKMLDDGIDSLNKGEPLDEVLEKMNLFPWLLMKLFGVAAHTGQMDKALMTAATEMEKQVDQKINKLTTVVEPMLIIVLSIIVGIILISVVLPVVNIMNSIG